MNQENNDHITYSAQLYDLLHRYNWQYFATLNVDERDPAKIEMKLNSWRAYIRKLQYDIGYLGLFNHEFNPHVHLLIVLNDKYPQRTNTIEDDIEKFAKKWNELSTRTAVIEKIYNIDGVCQYVAYQNTSPSKRFEIIKPIGTTGILKHYKSDEH
jgi:hypothetical protein